MKKSILNLGKVLTKTEQKEVSGGNNALKCESSGGTWVSQHPWLGGGYCKWKKPGRGEEMM